MDNNIGGVWRTVGGRRIFIKDGQDLATAMRESGKFKKNKDDRLGIFNENIIERDFKKLNKKAENLVVYRNSKSIQTIKGNSENSVGNLKTLFLFLTSKKGSLTAVHNHPHNSSFSSTDIKTFNRFKSINNIVVLTDNYYYCLSKNKVGKLNNKKLVSSYNKLYNNVKKKYGNNSESIHITNSIFSKKVGWNYERIKR